MSKEYVFRFQGNKEDFLNILNRYPHSSGDYRPNDYLVRVIGDEIHFGVERCGHSGGNWFISQINEIDNQIEFKGTIRHIGPSDDRSNTEKIFEYISMIFWFIILSPIFLFFSLYSMIEWCIRKIRKCPKPKNTEDKLFDLMENYFKCIRI